MLQESVMGQIVLTGSCGLMFVIIVVLMLVSWSIMVTISSDILLWGFPDIDLI